MSAAPVPQWETTSIREAHPEELKRWNEIVRRFPQCRVYHETAWIRSIATLTDCTPLFLVFEKNHRIVACLPGFLRRIGPLKLFGSPFEGTQTETMGPLYDPQRTSVDEFLPPLLGHLEKKYGVWHIEMVTRSFDREAMLALGFRHTPLSTYRALLTPGDEAATLARMKSNARNHLRKAQKLGLEVRIESGADFVPECFDQMQEVFTRRGNAIPFSERRVRICFEAMKSSDNLIALSVRTPDTGLPIATGIFLADNRELILWCWTHRTAHRASCPTELLTWTAMQAGMQRGCTSLDMTGGGSAKPKFGADAEENARWTRSRYSWIDVLRSYAARGYRLQQRWRGMWARHTAQSKNNPANKKEDDE